MLSALPRLPGVLARVEAASEGVEGAEVTGSRWRVGTGVRAASLALGCT